MLSNPQATSEGNPSPFLGVSIGRFPWILAKPKKKAEENRPGDALPRSGRTPARGRVRGRAPGGILAARVGCRRPWTCVPDAGYLRRHGPDRGAAPFLGVPPKWGNGVSLVGVPSKPPKKRGALNKRWSWTTAWPQAKGSQP